MKLNIPSSLLSHEAFLQLKAINDLYEQESADLSRLKSLPELYQLLELTTNDLDRHEYSLLFNLITTQKGVLNLINILNENSNIGITSFSMDSSIHKLTVNIDGLESINPELAVDLLKFSLLSLLWIVELLLIIESVIYLLSAELDYIQNTASVSSLKLVEFECDLNPNLYL